MGAVHRSSDQVRGATNLKFNATEINIALKESEEEDEQEISKEVSDKAEVNEDVEMKD